MLMAKGQRSKCGRELIILAFIAVVLMGCMQQPKTMYTNKEVVTVHAGDTVWGIASRYCGDVYMLEYLEELKALPENKTVLKANRLLQPGDKLTVLEIKK
jgi:nucleoid-associated protein YgaU